MLLLETPSIWESCTVRDSSRLRGRKPVFLYSSLGWSMILAAGVKRMKFSGLHPDLNL